MIAVEVRSRSESLSKSQYFRSEYTVSTESVSHGQGHPRGRLQVCCTLVESGLGDALLLADKEL